MDRVTHEWVRRVRERLPLPEPIVEFGGRYRPRDLERDGLRPLRELFPAEAKYISCDLRAGGGVDRVEDMLCSSFAMGSVGTVIACNVLEHVRDPIAAMTECLRILDPTRGVLLLQSVFVYHIHGAPVDYWRFTPFAFKDILLKDFPQRVVEGIGLNKAQQGPRWITGVATRDRWQDLTGVAECLVGAWEHFGQCKR
jgi:SAM-dependent methyltransferase